MTNTCPPSAWGRNTDTKPQTNYFKTLILVAQWCPTLCNHMDCSLAGSSVHVIVQARILKWVAILFSRGFSWLKDQTGVSCIADSLPKSEPQRALIIPKSLPKVSVATLTRPKWKVVCVFGLSHDKFFVTPCNVACQAPLSMGFWLLESKLEPMMTAILTDYS